MGILSWDALWKSILPPRKRSPTSLWPDFTVQNSMALWSCRVPCEQGSISNGMAIILTMNPDGVLLGSRANANRVDLNRNFPTANWQAEPVSYRWTLDDPERVTIRTGSKPGSEPETQSLIKLIDELQSTIVVSLHGPLACIDDPTDPPLRKNPNNTHYYH